MPQAARSEARWLVQAAAAHGQGIWRGTGMRTDPKSVIIGALLVAVLVLGYLYWDRQRNTVEIKLPSITVEKR
jgi:hypothetical protein